MKNVNEMVHFFEAEELESRLEMCGGWYQPACPTTEPVHCVEWRSVVPNGATTDGGQEVTQECVKLSDGTILK